MSGYQNVMRAMEQLKGTGVIPDFANKGNNISNIQTTGVNPYSSQAYSNFNYRDLINQQSPIVDERQMYSSMTDDMSKQDQLLLKGGKGLQGLTLGNQLSPYIGKGLTGLNNAISNTAVSSAGMQSFNLGPAAAVYSAFGTDNNPYTFTNQEKYGGTASNLMAAHQISKAIPMLNAGKALAFSSPAVAATATSAAVPAVAGINPYVAIAALAFSFFNNKRRKRKAKRANEKVAKQIGDDQTAQYEQRKNAIEGYRDEQLANQNQQMHMNTQSQYSNQYGGNYSNRYMADEGMKFSPQELNKIAKAGRNGDTMLAHINPQEAALLKSLGGSGTVNPATGLNEYGYGGNPLSVITDVIGGIGGGISDIVGAGGDAITGGIDTIINTGVDALQGAGDVATDVMGTVGDVVTPVIDPVFDAASSVVTPVMEGISDVVEPIAEGTLDVFGNVIEGTLDGVKTLGQDVLIPAATGVMKPIVQGFGDIIDFISGSGGNDDIGFNMPENFKGYEQSQRKAIQPSQMTSNNQVPNIGSPAPAVMGNKMKKEITSGDWSGFKDNQFLTENILEETDYAAQGMKYKYYEGGQVDDIVAEFTGNELIVNDQAKVEKALEDGNYRAAAAPIRRAMNNKQVTPGPETHAGNPMPVDKEGNIYSHGGKLKFKVKKGAGVYDHATDQFKPTMTDREIAMTAYNNMEKWKSNGMA